MARQYYKDSTTGQMKPLGVKVEDTLPVGTIVEYNGQNIPEGWVDIGNGKIEKQYQVIPTNALLENGDSTSATNGYTAEYINNHSVVVSPTEPSGSARKKVWLQRTRNIFNKKSNYTAFNQYMSVTELNTGVKVQCSTGGNYDMVVYVLQDVTKYVGKTFKAYASISASSNNVPLLRFVLCNKDGSNRSVLVDRTDTGSIETTIPTLSGEQKYLALMLASNNSATITAPNDAYVEYTNLYVTMNNELTEYEAYLEDKTYILNSNNEYEIFKPQNEIYSNNEVRIGTWTNGKPLYRKVFTGTCRSDANYIDLLTNVGIWFVEGGVIYETAEITRAYNYYFTQGQGNIDFDLVCGAGSLRFRARGAQIQGKNYMIIINYTKTTD